MFEYRSIIILKNNQRSHHMGYFDALFQSENKDIIIPEQQSRFASLQTTSPKARTPYLIEMNFLTRIAQQPHTAFPDPYSVLADRIIKYYRLYLYLHSNTNNS